MVNWQNSTLNWLAMSNNYSGNYTVTLIYSSKFKHNLTVEVWISLSSTTPRFFCVKWPWSNFLISILISTCVLSNVIRGKRLYHIHPSFMRPGRSVAIFKHRQQTSGMSKGVCDECFPPSSEHVGFGFSSPVSVALSLAIFSLSQAEVMESETFVTGVVSRHLPRP